MPTYLLIIVTVIYAWVAILFALNNHLAMSVVYVGYALANLGLIAVSNAATH